MKPLRNLTRAAIAVMFVTTAAIAIDGLNDEVGPADLIVVLGNEITDDGRPSLRLLARLDRALSLFREGSAPAILVSGGTGDSGFDEATVMAEHLVEQGVPNDAIWQDPHGVNTRATAVNTAVLLEAQGWQSVIVTTQYFHISRSKLAMR